MNALRVLARPKDPVAPFSIERHVDEYLKTETIGLTRALERLRKRIPR